MKSQPLTLASLLESFFRKRLVAQRRASPATIVAYRHALQLLLLFASERVGRPPSRLAVEDLNSDVVLAFLDHLEGNRGNCIRTRNARLAAIRSFFHHVAHSDPAGMGLAQRILGIPGSGRPTESCRTCPGKSWTPCSPRPTWTPSRDDAIGSCFSSSHARAPGSLRPSP